MKLFPPPPVGPMRFLGPLARLLKVTAGNRETIKTLSSSSSRANVFSRTHGPTIKSNRGKPRVHKFFPPPPVGHVSLRMQVRLF
jgi:hypothetical protein